MAGTTERAPMFGVSFFGVTPGFTHRDFCSDGALPSIIQECAGLYTLDQFTVRLPRNGTLYIFGGRMVDARHVTFIGLYRHAIEYKGSREGGHYGVGIWLVDSWIRPEGSVSGFLDRMIGFLGDQLVDPDGRVIRTFEQMDWGTVPVLLRELGGWRIDSVPMRDDVFFDGMGRKFLLAHEVKPIAPHSMRDLLSHMVYFFGREPVILRDRVIYTSFDTDTIRAIRDLNRVEVLSYEGFVEQYKNDLERHSSRLTSDANEPRSSFPLAEDDDRSDLSIRPTIPVRDDYTDNPRRSTAKSSSRSPVYDRKSSSRLLNRPSDQSTSGVVAQMLKLLRVNTATAVAGGVLTLMVFLVVQGPDILDFLRSRGQNKSPIVSAVPHNQNLSKTNSKDHEEKQEPPNAANPEKDLQCLKLKNPPPGTSDKDARLKSITEIDGQIKDFLKNKARYYEFNKGDMQVLNGLVQRERDYLRCLDGK
jgi:hypothetical protein